ncbi:hypothetical protein ANCCEY_04965 [Ancylostoma ceylanicum]|uniref:SXP/RAL-2 family protein Ani s 5-like cation-binding domain-containing protein n=1 Tax=Ancylostoma ceylanicum TaxID=53326 RepID=A0A0D6M7V7_9BILA|nr:hypothetical protein ANCCEY_04965 [Ancylostoma ceylanicum]
MFQNTNFQGGPRDGILANASPEAVRAYAQVVQNLSQSLSEVRTALEAWAKKYGLEQEFKKFVADSEKEAADFKKGTTELLPKLTQFFTSYIKISEDKKQSIISAFDKTAALSKALDDKQKAVVEFIMKTYLPSLGNVVPDNQGRGNNGGFQGNNGGFGGNNGGFQGNNGGFPGNNGGFPGNNGGFPGNNGGFSGNNGGFPGNNGGFSGNNGGFPGINGGFPGNSGSQWNNAGGFQGNNGGFEQSNGGFNGGFPSNNLIQGGANGGFNNGFFGNQGGFPGAAGGMTGNNGFIGNNGGYPGGSPKRPHFGVNALLENQQRV